MIINNLRTLLEQLGFEPLTEFPKEFRARPIYRESHNATSFRIHKNTGNWIDFGANIRGSIIDLVKLVKQHKNIQESFEFLKTHGYIYTKSDKTPHALLAAHTKTTQYQPITMTPKFSLDIAEQSIPDHSYWLKRNISLETIQKFNGGIWSGKMAHRYVFPIYNKTVSHIDGFAGRALYDNMKIKWKILGPKNTFLYPAFLNYDLICQSRVVILVESIGDMLSLFNIGIRNVLVTFGVEISPALLNAFFVFDPQLIVIAFNNDMTNGNVGQIAAQKAYNKLSRYFKKERIRIALPDKKDFNVMTSDEIQTWYHPISAQSQV